MNSTTLRRLAADHASLHSSPLPPHYLFPLSCSMPDDLTQLTILLAGPHGTSYAEGVWKLHLKIPEDYPKNPPKAAFKTRIWHPNVEEVSGAVCVDTLKRDWESKLTLRDVLITISCLLIHPNPDSALNSTAAALLQEDYTSFSRQATLMTSIHARIPTDLLPSVCAAQLRGEDPSATIPITTKTRPTVSRKTASTSSVNMKRPNPLHLLSTDPSRSISAPIPQPNEDETSDTEALNDENAENDPSLSPTPVPLPTLSPRRPTLTKRPLSDLPTPTESDSDEEGLSSSERNIAANVPSSNPPAQESLKLTERTRGINYIVSPGHNSALLAHQSITECTIFDEDEERPKKRVCSGEGKENAGEVESLGMKPRSVSISVGAEIKPAVGAGAGRKASAPATTAAAKAKAKGRAGLRRL